MGGTDDPSNLIELTVEQHAEEHRKLYEKYGLEEDRIAWQGLAGIIGHEEAVRQSLSLAGRKGMLGKKHKNSTKKLISEIAKNGFKNGRINPMFGVESPVKNMHWYNDGKNEIMAKNCPVGFENGRLPKSESTINKISKSLIGNTRRCKRS
jgi:hypothetical protein